MSVKPRVACPSCGRRVTARRDGTLTRHWRPGYVFDEQWIPQRHRCVAGESSTPSASPVDNSNMRTETWSDLVECGPIERPRGEGTPGAMAPNLYRRRERG